MWISTLVWWGFKELARVLLDHIFSIMLSKEITDNQRYIGYMKTDKVSNQIRENFSKIKN